MVTEKMIEAARDKFKELAGIQIYLPGEGTLDDFEQGRYDALVAALEAALSTDAEPVAWHIPGSTAITKDKDVTDRWRFGNPSTVIDPVYAAPPAPSVAVKALDEDNAQIIRDAIRSAYDRGYNDARNAKSVPGDTALGYRGRDMSEEIAVDYLARLRRQLTALSAQVQDLAGWQSMDSAPKDGTEFAAGRRYPSSNEFTVHTYKWDDNHKYWGCRRHGICIRQECQKDFVWFGLPAAPAAKQGEAE